MFELAILLFTIFLIWLIVDIKFNKSSDVILEYKKLDIKAIPPFKKRRSDAAWDIATIEGNIIMPEEEVVFNTGLIVVAPIGYYYTIDGRSGLSKFKVKPFRGTIDATYQGQLLISLTNHSGKPYTVKDGDRIAQITIHKAVDAEFKEVNEFSNKYQGRGTDGWGSSGR